MTNAAQRARPRQVAAIALLLTLAGCAGLDRNDQGVLQPQTVRGPCNVKKFYLLGFRAVPTEMSVEPGGTCIFTVLDPNLQAFPTAVLITSPASHGRAEAGLTNGGRSPLVSYTPQPGYAGPDRFTVTIEPNNHAIAVGVVVQPGR